MTTNTAERLELQIDPSEVIAEQHAQHIRELRRLDDIAFGFLNATNGDEPEAVNLLDDSIQLLFENGALSTWRYRIVLAKIREGL